MPVLEVEQFWMKKTNHRALVVWAEQPGLLLPATGQQYKQYPSCVASKQVQLP
jgi:hypothetical protein